MHIASVAVVRHPLNVMCSGTCTSIEIDVKYAGSLSSIVNEKLIAA